MTKVKICGITTLDDARAATQAGADMLGFNFYKRSSRAIDPDAALTICAALRAEFGTDCPLFVAVFVNEIVGRISMTLEKVGIKVAQLSGDESTDILRELRGIGFKAIRPRNKVEALDDAAYFLNGAPTDDSLPSLLLDAYSAEQYGGTGVQASLDIAQAVKVVVPRLMLAGGLTPENVGDVVRAARPWGVDVASGVEPTDQPGIKDHAKLRAFIDAVRAANENE
ncbi:MAG: phosphoribosylanthranilate isomerase [Chloroflexota bacterium]|nr:phosphoribosylanthranilate isomerase [Chloroflexota bacterium]